jgi:predicted Rossmann fold nucleotide-binding protein DprA/Smf involved in DNA uptake
VSDRPPPVKAAELLLPPRKPTRTDVKRELRRITRDFADTLIETLDRLGVWNDNGRDEEDDDLAATRVRRTAPALGKLRELISDDLRARRRPVAISTIARSLGLTTREISHPLALLVQEGKVRKTGERRGTCYRLARPRRSKRRPPDPPS